MTINVVKGEDWKATTSASIYSSPSTTSAKVATVPTGTVVRSIAEARGQDGGSWRLTEYQGKLSWFRYRDHNGIQGPWAPVYPGGDVKVDAGLNDYIGRKWPDLGTVTPPPVEPPPVEPPPVEPPPTATGYVRASGTSLILDGKPYRFIGLNVPSAAAGDNYTRFSDMLRDVPGIDAVRVWTTQAHATKSGVRDWTNIDNMLAAAEAKNVKVIMVLVDMWTGQSKHDYNANLNLAWFQNGYKSAVGQYDTTNYRQWIQEIAARYKNRTGILCWQLGNEISAEQPDGSCPNQTVARDALRAFADDCAGAIKAIDPNHMISLGTVAGQCGSGETAYAYIHAGPNIDVADLHDYTGTRTMSTEQYNGMQVNINRIHALGKPVFTGESGVDWIKDCNNNRDTRKTVFKGKIDAQLGAGMTGFLMWTWGGYTMNTTWGLEIPVGDPTLTLLPNY